MDEARVHLTSSSIPSATRSVFGSRTRGSVGPWPLPGLLPAPRRCGSGAGLCRLPGNSAWSGRCSLPPAREEQPGRQQPWSESGTGVLLGGIRRKPALRLSHSRNSCFRWSLGSAELGGLSWGWDRGLRMLSSSSTRCPVPSGGCSLKEVAYFLCAQRLEQMRVQLLMQKWFSSRLHAEPIAVAGEGLTATTEWSVCDTCLMFNTRSGCSFTAAWQY